MNKKLLESAMKKYGDTQGTLADFLGITRGSINKKINETNASFTQPEIKSIKERYDLTAQEIDENFFAEKSILKRYAKRKEERKWKKKNKRHKRSTTKPTPDLSA